jgi:hypothetical protein
MEEFETLSEQLARVTAECERLREENARLCYVPHCATIERLHNRVSSA